MPLIPPDLPGYEVATQYEPAREVGGDFFDVFRIQRRQGRLAVCIADVTGKGIAAALLMAFARPLLHAAIDHALAPGDALERTNKILVEERRSALFITALCATIDMRAGILRLANAGHEPPLLLRSGDDEPVWLEASGPLLGAYRRLDLTECTIALEPGDLVLLYTDGVTDAQAADGERFGEARLVEAVRSAPSRAAADVVGAVCDAYHLFQGDMPAADDVTMVAIRRLPRRGRASGGARDRGPRRVGKPATGSPVRRGGRPRSSARPPALSRSQPRTEIEAVPSANRPPEVAGSPSQRAARTRRRCPWATRRTSPSAARAAGQRPGRPGPPPGRWSRRRATARARSSSPG